MSTRLTWQRHPVRHVVGLAVVALAVAACGSSGAAPTNVAAAGETIAPTTAATAATAATSAATEPAGTPTEHGADPTAFCDAVAEFDGTSSPGGPAAPTAEEMETYVAAIRPMVDDMAASAPSDAVDAVAALGTAVDRAADGDIGGGEDPALDAALSTIEDSVRANCDVAIVDVVGADFRFDVPETIPAGPVSFRLDNQGKQFHVFLLLKAPPEGTDDVEFLTRFMDAASSVDAGGDPTAMEEFAAHDVEGNPPAAEPGGTGTAVKVLEPGEYLYFCPIPMDLSNPESPAHFEAGMHGRFTVES